KERKGEILLTVHKLLGVPLGPDIGNGNGAAPQDAQATPGGGHGVAVLLVPGGNEHPLVTNGGKDVKVQLLGFHFFQHDGSLLVSLIVSLYADLHKKTRRRCTLQRLLERNHKISPNRTSC